MTIKADIIAALRQAKSGTAETIAPLLPQYSLKQVMNGLQMAAHKKQIKRIGKMPPKGFARGQGMVVYGPLDAPPMWMGQRPVNSVWELGRTA